MPRGPNGEERPADTARCAYTVFQVAVGELEEKPVSARRRSGVAGATARKEALSPAQRSAIAKKAAAARRG